MLESGLRGGRIACPRWHCRRPATRSTALVTGASSGIGEEIARQLAARGHGVTLVARREDRLRELAGELADEHGIRAEVIAADLGDAAGRDRLAAEIAELGLDVEILVNNAGFGGFGTSSSADRERLVAWCGSTARPSSTSRRATCRRWSSAAAEP